MPANYSQPIARENYLKAVDELVARLGKDQALHFMRQAASAVDGKPSPLSPKRVSEMTVRQRSAALGDVLVEAARP
jgi:hypothetical protein